MGQNKHSLAMVVMTSQNWPVSEHFTSWTMRLADIMHPTYFVSKTPRSGARAGFVTTSPGCTTRLRKGRIHTGDEGGLDVGGEMEKGREAGY